MATRETNEERVRAVHARMVASVAELVSGEDWAAMLAVSARFHAYSPRNVLLIVAQRPDATRVAGYKVWQSLGRQVRKGERGIAILAPVVARAKTTDDGDGDVRLRGFRVAYVFDVAQTEGDPLPDVPATLLTGAAPVGLWDEVAALVAAEGYTIERSHSGEANGSANPTTKVVEVRADLEPAQAAKTLTHELAHVRLGHTLERYAIDRARCEVEAESVAHIVAAAVGLGTEAYSFPYVAHWAAGDPAAVAETAERVIACARTIVDALPIDHDGTAVA
jgi:antirestriction protein ArdC